MAGRPYPPTGYRAALSPVTGGFADGTKQATNLQEWYSWAVVSSIVAAAGLVGMVTSPDVNRRDMQVETLGSWEGRQRSIRLQLKSSSTLIPFQVGREDFVSHSFERDYYDDLLAPATMPIFVVVVALPQADEPWLRLRQSIHAQSAAAWWAKAEDPSNGKASQTLRIPASQRLDVSAFQTMMRQA